MADFSELCPLFNIGVFGEVTFPNLLMTDITASGNVLLGTITAGSATRTNFWTFGRTVIVTGGWIRNRVKPAAAQNLKLMHHTTALAAGTEFGTLAVSTSINDSEIYTWVPINDVTAKTFTSSEILGLTVGTGTAANGGIFDMILQYKEK